jgi:enamine deaminase RidA (YjgF/YER057c/UK114 family)
MGARSRPHGRNRADRYQAAAVATPGGAGSQAVHILDRTKASLAAPRASIGDVIRKRIYLADVDDWEAVSRALGRYLGHVKPASTLIETGRLVWGYKVEMEAEAQTG